MSVARNVFFDPTLAPGGGATEMAISVGLHAKARTVTGVEGWPFRAVADAMEVIPRTLVQNSGGNAIRVLTELRVRFGPRTAATDWVSERLTGYVSTGKTCQRRALVGHQR